MPLGKIIEKEFPSIIPEISSFSVNTYSPEELCAQKIAACLDRGAPRDIFDIFQYSNISMDLDEIKKFAPIYFILVSDSEKIDLSKIEQTDSDRLSDGLRQFLRDGTGIDFRSMKHSALEFLSQVLDFNNRYQEFIDRFFKENQIFTKLVLPNGPDLNEHPVIKHIMQNRRKTGK